ncbi:MAG: hypothetical protein HY698_01640 [Deltaproteobacteria bacterium]|nr:hypothetical protein [Deltaproteobacteria bacterium]
MATRDSTRKGPRARQGKSATSTEGNAAARVAELEEELRAAQKTISALIEKAERNSGVGDAMDPENTARLEHLIAARTRELEEKTEALEAANKELRTLTQNLDQMVRQRTRALAESEAQHRRKNLELDRLNRMKGEFIAIAAHELRTPMTSIVGYLDLIVAGHMGDLPAELRRPISSIRRNAHRLKRLVDDMFDASRLESGRIALKRMSCSLGVVVIAVEEELRPLAAEKSQRIECRISDIPPIDADPDKIHQVVLNLVANSIKYTPPGGAIRVTVDLEEPASSDGRAQARLRVWDNGAGIPQSLRARIFEPFSDVNEAKHHTSAGPDSAGLGLFIARGIVELHGGSIVVDSEEGAYSEFTVRLPLVG